MIQYKDECVFIYKEHTVNLSYNNAESKIVGILEVNLTDRVCVLNDVENDKAYDISFDKFKKIIIPMIEEAIVYQRGKIQNNINVISSYSHYGSQVSEEDSYISKQIIRNEKFLEKNKRILEYLINFGIIENATV